MKDSDIKEPFSNSKNYRGDKIFDSEESNSPKDGKWIYWDSLNLTKNIF